MARAFSLGEHELVVDPELGTVTVPITTGAPALTLALRHLDADKIPIEDISFRRPSLDDVFLTLTGRATEEERPDQAPPRTQFQGRRD
jgi:ABC-2 type transport system ATP-binding protein